MNIFLIPLNIPGLQIHKIVVHQAIFAPLYTACTSLKILYTWYLLKIKWSWKVIWFHLTYIHIAIYRRKKGETLAGFCDNLTLIYMISNKNIALMLFFFLLLSIYLFISFIKFIKSVPVVRAYKIPNAYTNANKIYSSIHIFISTSNLFEFLILHA
jgi:hypothetical protein